METIEIRVNVPVDRETEFYRWFADWKEGVIVPSKGDLAGDVPAADATLESAIAWWKLLTPKESAIWSIWVDAAPSMVTADSIVAALGMNGPRDIPGALAWSNRKGKKVGFDVDWRSRNDPATGASIYGIEDSNYADILRQARDESVLSAPLGL